MKTFTYRGFDAAGRGAHGLIEALDAKEARERLAARGVLPERVEAAAASGGRRRGLSAALRAESYREWGALLRAGVPMVPSLDIIIQAQENADAIRALASLRDRMREGGHVAESLAAVQPGLPAFERAVIEAGERTGSLGLVLDRVADHLDEENATRERLVSAAVYPAFVVLLALVVGVAMFGFILPNLQKIFVDSQVALPALTRGMLAIGRIFFIAAVPLLAVLLLLSVFGAAAWRSRPALRERWQRRLLTGRWLGRRLALLVSARFADTLSLLLRGGVQMVEAVELAGAATGNTWLQARCAAVAADIRHGRALSAALHQAPALGGSLGGWIAAGEAAGDVPGMLEQASRRLRHQWQQQISRLLAALEPALILLVGIFVLIVALSVLLPILSLNKSFG